MSIKENYEFWKSKYDDVEKALPVFAPVFVYEDLEVRGCPAICFFEDIEKFVIDLIATYVSFQNIGDLVDLLCIAFYDHKNATFKNLDKPFRLSVKHLADAYKKKEYEEFMDKNVPDELKE